MERRICAIKQNLTCCERTEQYTLGDCVAEDAARSEAEVSCLPPRLVCIGPGHFFPVTSLTSASIMNGYARQLMRRLPNFFIAAINFQLFMEMNAYQSQ